MMLLMAFSLATHVETLRCGAAEWQMTSRTVAGTRAPVRQALTGRVGKKRVAIALERGGRVPVDGHRVQNRYVGSWACLTGKRGAHYVMLGYSCAVDAGYPNDCGGEKEWFRLLDARGRFTDAGAPHDGAVRDRLYARLGLAAAMAAGVKMTDLLE
jgi:hypothetical protein